MPARSELTKLLASRSPADLRTLVHQLQSVHDVSEAIIRASSAPELYDAALDGLLSVLAIDRAAILLFDADGVMRFRAWRGLSADYRRTVEGHSPWRADTPNPEPVLVADAAADPAWADYQEVFRAEGIGALAFVPLPDHRGLAGKFMLYCNQPHVFTDEEVQLAGTIARLIGMGLERVRREEARASTEARYREFIERSPDPLLVTRPGAHIVAFANPAALALLGAAAPGEVVGRSLLTFVHPRHHATAVAAERQIFGAQGASFCEQQYLRLDGSTVDVEVTAAPTILDGSPAAILIARDITGRLRDGGQRATPPANGDPDASDQVPTEALAAVLHDLRTPLNAVLGWVQVLRRGTADHVTLERGLEAVERNAWMQARLIEDLLDLARLRSGMTLLNSQPVALDELLRAAIDAVRSAADHKQLVIRLAEPRERAAVLGDPVRLQQIFWNVVGNAVKFTPPGGTIDVSTTLTPAAVTVAVTDSGVGIPAELLPHVFDRYVQAEPATPGGAGGLGLGLWIVRQLVQMHGGTVTAASGGKGRGARFAISLPRCATPAATTPED